MWVVVVLEFVVALGAAYAVLSRYASVQQTNIVSYLTTLVGFAASFFIVFLLTLDVSSTLHDDDCADGTCGAKPGNYLSHDARIVLWNVFYWTAFSLTWLIVPLQQSYVEAGNFSVAGKIKTSLKENALFYTAMGAVFAVFLIYIMATKHLYGSDLAGFAIAASNAWGLFVLVALLGYGLVEVPRKLWHAPDYARGLRLAEFQADALLTTIEDAKTELVTVVATIKNLEELIPRHFASLTPFYDILVAAAPLEYEARMQLHLDDEDTAVSMDEISRSYLAALHGRLKRASRNLRTSEAQFEDLMDHAFFLQDVVKAKNSPARAIVSLLKPHREGRFAARLDEAEWWWYTRIAPIVLRVVAVLLALLSLAVVWSECVLFLVNSKHKDTTLSLFALAIHADGVSDFGLQALVFLPVAYLCVCAYSTLFKIQIFSYYKLIPNKLSSANSILFSAAYLSRLAAPLCYNYLLLIHEFNGVDTAFATIMGDMTAVPFLGEQFNTIFPLFILVLTTCTLFNMYGRILACLGVRSFNFQSSFDDSSPSPGLGSSIVSRERSRRERKVKSAGRSPSRGLASSSLPGGETREVNLDVSGFAASLDRSGFGRSSRPDRQLHSLLAAAEGDGRSTRIDDDDDDLIHDGRGRGGDDDDDGRTTDSPVYRFSGRNLFDDLQ